MNPIALRFGFWVLAPPLLIAAIGFGLQGLAAANSALFFTWGFFLEVLLAGLLQGVLYALVALGFVLIFKASGIFNFAQGSMVLFAALTLVGRSEEHTSELQSLMRSSYAVFCLKKKTKTNIHKH